MRTIDSGSHQIYFISSIAIFWIGLTLRLTHLLTWPVFVDEGHHLVWGQLMAQGRVEYPFLLDGRFLLGITLSLLQVYGPHALWVGRAGTALLGLLGCAACMLLGRQIGGKQVGLLAGSIYAVLPYTIFHERQILADPMYAALGTLFLTTLIRLARQPNWPRATLGSLFFALALGFKITAGIYLVALVWAVVWLPTSWEQRRRLAFFSVSSVVLGVLWFGGIGLIFRPWLGLGGHILVSGQAGIFLCPPLVCSLDLSAQWQSLANASQQLWEIITTYWGWGLVILAVSGVSVRRNREHQFVWWTGFSILGFFYMGTPLLIPRYLNPVTTLLIVSASVAFFELLKNSIKPSLQITLAILGVVGLFYPLMQTSKLMSQVDPRNLPSPDVWQYFTGPYSLGGLNLEQVATDILARDSHPVILVNGGALVESVRAYFDPRQVVIEPTYPALAPQVKEILSQGRSIYLVDRVPVDSPALPEIAELIGTYPHYTGWVLRVRRFESSEMYAEFIDEMTNPTYTMP